MLYDPQRMADCIGAIQVSDCSSSDLLRIQAACADAFQGLIAPGQGCNDARECTSGVCNVSDCSVLCCPGTCAIELPRTDSAQPAGAPCTGATSCQSPLVCDAGICSKRPGRGQACDLPPGPLTCDRVDDYCDPVTRICTALSSEGQPCAAPDPATLPAGTCAVDAWCDGGLCTARPKPGQPCTLASGCTPGISCDSSTGLCSTAPIVTACPL